MAGADISQKEYWQELRDLAKGIIDELRDEGVRDDDEIDEKAYDKINETVDGHRWIIYNAYHLDVIKNSNNDSYWLDNFGEYGSTDFSDIMTKTAYGAMYGDLQDEMSEEIDLYKREIETEEEEADEAAKDFEFD